MYTKRILLLQNKMIEYFAKDPKRINHFLKVHSYGVLIGRLEKIDEQTLYILEAATLIHDIGIKNAVAKYGNSNGKKQEIEGPVVAKKMLWELGFDEKIIDRIVYLVGNHHTYSDIVGWDYQILVETDFLVNFYEDEMSKEAIKVSMDKIFKTETGKRLCKAIFL